MSYDYSTMVNTAIRLINRFGANYTFTHYEQGVFNDDTGKYDEVETTYMASFVKSSFSAFDKSNLDIQSEDIKLVAVPANYTIGDTVVISSKSYKIQDLLKIVEPANTKIIYVLQVRI